MFKHPKVQCGIKCKGLIAKCHAAESPFGGNSPDSRLREVTACRVLPDEGKQSVTMQQYFSRDLWAIFQIYILVIFRRPLNHQLLPGACVLSLYRIEGVAYSIFHMIHTSLLFINLEIEP